MVWLCVVAAMFACVPETDQFRPVVVMILGVGLIELLTRRPLPAAATVAVIAVLAWAGYYGAVGQHRAYVGAAFAFWPAVLAIGLAVAWPSTARKPLVGRWLVIVIGTAAALIVARTGALEPGYRPALEAVAVWAPVSAAVAIVVMLISPTRPADPTDQPASAR